MEFRELAAFVAKFPEARVVPRQLPTAAQFEAPPRRGGTARASGVAPAAVARR